METFLVILGVFAAIALMCVIAAWWGKRSNEKWKRSVGIDPNDPDGFTKYQQEQRWKWQEEKDRQVLSENPAIKRQMENAFANVQAVYESAKIFNDEEYRCEIYMRALTPEVFLTHYDAFKSKDRRTVKDAIYKEYPYFTHDLLITMGIYIFETHHEIDVLKKIIKSEDENLAPYSDEAENRLNREMAE